MIKGKSNLLAFSATEIENTPTALLNKGWALSIGIL